MGCKVLTGLTPDTPKKLLLDAGAFFADYDMENDTFDSAIAAGKLLGATKGGGSASFVASMRKVEIDGVRGDVKGLSQIERWDVKIGANVVEFTSDVIQKALGASRTVDGTTYTEIRGKNCLDETDYIGNITWVGTLSGNENPVIIQIFNALNTKGLELSVEDKGEATTELEFVGHYEMVNNSEPPFAIFYPKEV